MAHALRLLQQGLKPAGAPDAAAYVEYAARLASGLSRAAQGHGRCRRQALARRRISRARLHHAFLRRRPPRQHRGGDADAALVVRLEIRDAAHRHRHEQRHHVVRPDARHHKFARTRQALPHQLHACYRRDQGRQAPRGRRVRRPPHPAVSDAARVVCDGFRHGSRCRHPPAAHRRQRGRDRDRRRPAAGGSAQGAGGTLRL